MHPGPLHVALVVWSRQSTMARVWRGEDDVTMQNGDEGLDENQLKGKQNNQHGRKADSSKGCNFVHK